MEPSQLILEVKHTDNRNNLARFYRYEELREGKEVKFSCTVSDEMIEEGGKTKVIKSLDFIPQISHYSNGKTAVQKLLIRNRFLSMPDHTGNNAQPDSRKTPASVTDFKLTLKYPGWSHAKTVTIDDIDGIIAEEPENREANELKFLRLYLENLFIKNERYRKIREKFRQML